MECEWANKDTMQILWKSFSAMDFCPDLNATKRNSLQQILIPENPILICSHDSITSGDLKAGFKADIEIGFHGNG